MRYPKLRLLAEDHLRFLYGQTQAADGLLVIYTKDPHEVDFFCVDEIEQAVEHALRVSQTRDVYHLVNLISAASVESIRSRHGRGRESELEAVVAIVCELDTNVGSHRETDYPTQEKALEALSEMPLRPSLVNLSGRIDGGLHVYWRLKRPVCVVNSKTRARVKAISKAWQEMLRARVEPYRLDSTHDLVRVLRVGGCRNHKYEEAVTRPIVVEDRRYELEDFARFSEQKPRDRGEARSRNLAPSLSTRVERCRKYLEQIPDAVSGQHGHDKTFRAACECFRFGLSLKDAKSVMAWFNNEKTPAEDKWSDAELEHKLETAQKTVDEAGQFGLRVQR